MQPRPPKAEQDAALALARRLGRAVYLYRGESGWALARRPAEIPGGAPAYTVPPDPDDPERHNRGGC